MKKREIIFDSYLYIFPAISTTANPSMHPCCLPALRPLKSPVLSQRGAKMMTMMTSSKLYFF